MNFQHQPSLFSEHWIFIFGLFLFLGLFIMRKLSIPLTF